MNNHMLLTAEAVAQWLPLPTQNIDDSRSRVRSFLDVFPYATVWTSEFHEMLLVGSMEPIELDTAKISQRFQQDTVRSTLQEVGIGSATALTDRAGLERFAADAQPVTDDQPRTAGPAGPAYSATAGECRCGFQRADERTPATPDAVLSGEPACL